MAALGLTAACGSSSGTSGSAPGSDSSGSSGSVAASNAPEASGSGNGFAAGSAVDVASVKKMFSDAMSAASTVHVDMTMAGTVKMSGSGDMDLKSKPVKADLKLASSSLGSSSIEMLMVDDAAYIHMPQLGQKYMKISMTGKNSPLAQIGLSSLDPTAMFDRFSDAVSGGTYVGKETVDGTPTDHYQLNVDTKALASAMPSSAAGAATAVPATEKVDVWFDGDGRYKQLRMVTGGETVTEQFTDWGKAVSVKAPPANDVQDVTGMLDGKLGGSTGSTK